MLRLLGEYRGKQELFYQRAPETLNSLKLLAKVRSSESSNRLEGIEADHETIREIVLNEQEPITRSEQEIAGYRNALNLIHESNKEIPFTPNHILQLHKMLCEYTPNPGGDWKITNNEILETHPDGKQRTRFVPTAAHLTTIAMETLTVDSPELGS